MSCLDREPLILITNDDGIDSPGLLAAAEAAASIGRILVVAPHTQQTGMGRSFPRRDDTGIIEERILCIGERPCIGYAVHGSPAQAVAHAVREITDQKPDLCVSGINYGENPGMVLTCSGTVGAAIEAVSHGIPAIAVSVFAEIEKHQTTDFEETDWQAAQKMIRYFGKGIIQGEKYQDIEIFNINVPSDMEQPHRWKFTSQSRQNYFEFIRPKKRDYKKTFHLPAKVQIDIRGLEKDSDIYAVCVEHIISVTPLSLDMTVRRQIGHTDIL